MRVSDSSFRLNLLRSLRANATTLGRAQQRAATGHRIERTSDDPVGAAQVMRLESQLREISQFRSNGVYAQTRLSAEDVTLTAARDLLDQAKKLAMGAASAAPGDPSRDQAMAQIDVIREELVALANTRVGSEYIFAGGRSGTPPFLADGSYVGDTTTRRVEVDAQNNLVVNHTGDQVFSAAFANLDALQLQLQNGTSSDINTAAATVESDRVHLLSLQAEVGARIKNIDDIGTRLTISANTVSDARDAVRDVPQAEAIIEAMTAQTALERTYELVGRIAQLNLASYLT